MRRILDHVHRRLSVLFVLFFVLAAGSVTSPASAAGTERRLAFVVGNESYAAGALPTAANDAGLIAQTLQAAGFEVVGARDLDAETLRQSYAEFLKRLGDAGPDTVAFVYLAGYGLQYGNANYYVPIGANVSRDLDIPVATVRLSDLTGPLEALNLKARFMVFDAAYKPPFKTEGAPLAGGLALIDASPGSLIAYNAAPGTIALPGKGNYGVYAQSLAAMLREGGLTSDEIFDRLRLRVDTETKGAAVPWDSSKIDAAFRFFDRGKDAPAPAADAAQLSALSTKPLKDLPVKQAYTAAIARDTVASYTEFNASYGSDPLDKRIRVLLAVRREAVTWRRTIAIDTPDAYWSYLSRYPRGSHAGAARLRLEELSAALVPPNAFQAIVYDVPPPPPDEAVYIDQPVVYLDDPAYDFPPPPPPPDYWLPPVPVDFLDLPPPPPPLGLFLLPVPVFVPIPVYYNPPPFVAYPPDNYFYAGDRGPGNGGRGFDTIHRSFPAGALAVGAGAAAVAAAVVLPGAVRQRSTTLQQQGITTPAQLREARTRPGGLGAGAAGTPAADRRLPGVNGHALPAVGSAAPAANPTRANELARPVTANPRQPDLRRDQVDRAGQKQTPPRAGERAAGPERRIGAAGGQRLPAAQRAITRPPGAAAAGRRPGPGAAQVRPSPAQVRRNLPQVRQAPPQFRQGPPQARQAPPQFRQGPPQIRQAAPQFRPPPRQFAPPQARPPMGGFGGGGPRPGGFGGGGRPPPAMARPAPGGGGHPPPQPGRPHP